METEETKEGLTAQEVMEYSTATLNNGIEAVCASYKEFPFYKKLSAEEKMALSNMTASTTDLALKISRILLIKYITESPLNIAEEDCKNLTNTYLIPIFSKAKEINKSILEITEFVKERNADYLLFPKGYTNTL